MVYPSASNGGLSFTAPPRLLPPMDLAAANATYGTGAPCACSEVVAQQVLPAGRMRAILRSSGCGPGREGSAMTTPHSPGWYDDPDGSGAERFFDGNGWTPQRRRKSSSPTGRGPSPDATGPHSPGPTDSQSSSYADNDTSFGQPASGYPAPYPAASAGSAGFPDQYSTGYPYTASPVDPYGFSSPTSVPYPAYGPYDPSGAGGAPSGPSHFYGSAGTPAAPVSSGAFAAPHQPGRPPRLWAGIAQGADRVVGLVTAACGAALVIASFLPWGRVSAAGRFDDGLYGSRTLAFPGLGKPSMTVRISGDGTSMSGKIETPELNALQNTNPGWIALLMGIIAILAGIAYL